MKHSSGTGKTKGKTKAVDPVRHGKRGDTGKVARSRRGTNPIVLLIVFPLVLGGGGFLGWYYYKYGHFPLFVTEEQRQQSLREAKTTWSEIQDSTLKQWNVTKEQLAAWDKKYSAEYDEYMKDKAKRRQQTAFLLDEPAAPPPVVRKPSQRYLPQPRVSATADLVPPRPTQVVPPVTPVAPATQIKPVTPPPTGPVETPATPAQPVETPAIPAPPVQPVETPATPVTPPPPAYDPAEDSNYKAAAASYDAAFDEAAKGDSGEGDAAIKAYTAAVAKIDAATDAWKRVVEKAKAEGVPSEGIEKSIANCNENRKTWQENIETLKKAAEAPPPAAGGAAGGGSGFYDSHPKWIEGKKVFKEGYDIFTKNISVGTHQDSHTLNKYIDQAVVKFNRAEELWTAAEDDWLKKYPGNKGPKADADLLDKAMGESQFFRYGCMKMHTFER